MPETRTPLRLADAVLDGERIDWTRATAGGASDASAVIEGLRAVDRIARTSRFARPSSPPLAGARPLPIATRALLLVIAVQVIGGLLGYFQVDGSVQRAASLATVAAFGGAAVWLLGAGSQDDRSRYLAIFFLLVAAAFARQFLAPVAASPLAPLVLGVFPDAFLPLFLWKFVKRFPRVAHFSRADAWCTRFEHAALAAGLILFLSNIAMTYGASLPPALNRSHPRSAYWGAIALLALPALPMAWLRARSSGTHERRRLALFTCGLGLGIVPPLLELVAELAVPAFSRVMSAPGVRTAAAPLFFAPMLTVPFSTAYAVLVERVLGVRVVVGRALRYALTRTGVVLASLAPLAAFAAYAYRHRDLSLAALVSGRPGMLLLSLATAGALAWIGRRYLLGLVDRHFLRTDLDLARELAMVSAELAHTRSVDELAGLLESSVARVLGVRRASLLVLDTPRTSYLPYRGDLPALPADGALVAVAAAGTGPIVVDPADGASYFLLLPDDARRWIAGTGAALLVPLAGAHDAPIGLLLLAAKHNEMPFARDERSFLGTLAAAAALALETRGPGAARAAAPSDGEPARACEACGVVDALPDPICACGGRRRTAFLPLVLSGKFRVECVLGAGGMGVVYRARDLALNRPVALKTLPKLSAEAAGTLGQEARMMATVAHPNLATIYGSESWRRTPIIVVELLEGGTLADRGTNGQPIEHVLRVGVRLASALEALHAEGILHRDIKPTNIAFSAAGVPKLLDFGIASLMEPARGSEPEASRIEAGTTQSFIVGGHCVAGTPLYLSPEAARGEAPQPGFDVWSLSMVLYETIAGAHPLAATTVDDVLRNVRLARVPDIRVRRPDCPAPVASMFACLLSADPSRRPASALALRQKLEACAGVSQV